MLVVHLVVQTAAMTGQQKVEKSDLSKAETLVDLKVGHLAQMSVALRVNSMEKPMVAHWEL